MLRPGGRRAKKGEGKRDIRNEIANNGRGERGGERDEGGSGRKSDLHASDRGRKEEEGKPV